MNQAHTIAEDAKYLSHDEVSLIQTLALYLPVNATCVNLGCGPGTSVVALLEAREDLIVYSVDFKPSKELEQFARAGVTERVIEMMGNSHTLEWTHGEIDWIFVDTDHNIEAITLDIEHWLPHARGQVLFHDYNNSMGAKNWADVKEAVDLWAGEREPIAVADSLIVFDLSYE